MAEGADGARVRLAWPPDAEVIAALQVRLWPEIYADVLPAESATLDLTEVAGVWARSLTAPADARQRVLLAVVSEQVVGLVLTMPAADPDCDPVRDGEVAELMVEPAQRHSGHGSRLLAAALTTLAADHFHRAVCWVPSTHDDTRRFLAGAGWVADGAHRELAAEGGQRVKQIRLHVSLD